MQTLIQYEESRRARACAEYGITRAEYDRHYPRGSRADLWVEYLDRETRNGGELTRYVEQSLRSVVDDSDRADRLIRWLAHNVELAHSRAV